MLGIRKTARLVLAGAGISMVGGAFAAQPAVAAWRITQPANPYVYILKADGTPDPFDIQSSGWRNHQLVWVEICDGEPATATGWSPGLDCDSETSPSPVAANKAGIVTFPAASNNYGIAPFHGASPNGSFDCIANNEVPSDAKAATGTDSTGKRFTFYNLSATDTKTPDGIALAPGTRAWTDCQLRVASNYTVATSDQQFTTLLFPAAKDPHSGSSNTAVYVAVGVVAFLTLVGVGLFLLRRRQPAAATARGRR